MNEPVWKIKKEICDVGTRIWQRGYCAGNEGNHSVRIGADRVLCTPTGLSKGFLSPEDICLTDMDGNQVEPNPRGRKRTSEVLLHLAIYRKRDDVKAVVHSHPPHATAFAIANIPLPEGIHPEAEVFLGKVPMARFAMPSTPDLPESIVPLIGSETNTVLMGNHGTVNFSSTLIDTYYKLEILDAYCRLLLLAHQLGTVHKLSDQDLAQLLKIKEKFGMTDSRLACALDGCVGAENQAFLATFDVRPVSASCSEGGQALTTHSPTQTSSAANGGFEAMVQVITDQIMGAVSS